uniref:DNA-directed RNA polymerase III subunit RPC7-like n=1 Tax=Sinocyclocheilus anshuiensis TaxID=1608454 RepID=A0A671NUA7_9TELE
MAGSRGRGRSQFSFSVDALGFGRGDCLPSSAHTPSPLYPPMQFRPVPLHTGEEVDYMLALKQELRASSKNLPFHIKAARTKTGKTDWSRMPKELCIKVRKPRKTGERNSIIIITNVCGFTVLILMLIHVII